jgi:hypothetical protein
MEIGRDTDSVWRNMWPSEADAPGFKPFMLEFFEVCPILAIERNRLTNHW